MLTPQYKNFGKICKIFSGYLSSVLSHDFSLSKHIQTDRQKTINCTVKIVCFDQGSLYSRTRYSKMFVVNYGT